jgi:type II secretory pathway pseudopilin PulG
MRRHAGFSLLEMIVALQIALAVGLIVAGLLAHLLASAQVEPERTDRDHRLRLAADAIAERLRASGAGLGHGGAAGPLGDYLPALFPHRRGTSPADAELSAFDDRFTVLALAAGGPQAAVLAPMASPASPIPVLAQPGCPAGQPACGFVLNQAAIVFDRTGAFDVFRVSDVQPDAVLHAPAALSRVYGPAGTAHLAVIDMRAFWLDGPHATLRQITIAGSNQPVADHVVDLRLRYFGDAAPPLRPRPPLGVSTCLFDAAGQPLLPTLVPTDGPLVELTLAMLSDGPVCGVAPNRFDADLYRIRRVRVTLRVEAGPAQVRGTAPALFRRPGQARSAATSVPDEEVSFDVALRNIP